MNINNINNWLNSLNEFQEGLSLIIFGCLVFVISKFLHKDYTHDGYKPFKSFRRKNKSQSEDNFFHYHVYQIIRRNIYWNWYYLIWVI
ncbi:hypothetical protein L100_08259 [Elizabethkingia meningoseptica ATCC 13253 = NBRC 12535]|nr:hypothetical protein L100_08259 [Elizabethkingia meningoseptica ATCC 13253 = NBRC 12535]